MKSIFKNIMLLGLLVVSVLTYSQQDPHYTQYMYNTMSVNPAYAGSKGYGVINLLARTQWVGFKGAPDSQILSFDTPLGYSNIGLGVNIVNDKLGPSNEIYLDANASYAIQTGENGSLSLGLKLGGRLLNIDWSKGNFNKGDKLYETNINNKFMATVGAGVYYYTPKAYVGLSVPNFLKRDYYDDNVQSVAVERMHFFLIGGYVFDLTEKVKFKPATLFKIVSGAPISFDVSANFLFNNIFRAGISYRYNDSISALLGFQATEAFQIGYAYDLTTSNYSNYNSGTHEIMLRYELFKGGGVKSPRFF